MEVIAVKRIAMSDPPLEAGVARQRILLLKPRKKWTLKSRQ
jgi:hypothetical protein